MVTPRVAVCLQTCDRLSYTKRTLESFVAQHRDLDPSRWLLLHGDDASSTPAVFDVVKDFGFETVVRHERRNGARATRGDLFTVASARGADWILLLENDWEWVRPFPWALFDYLVQGRPDVYSLRLYGAFKGRDKQYRCSLVNHGKPARKPVPWWRLPGAPEPCEIGRMHWGAPPAVTRVAELQTIQRIVVGNCEPGDRQEMYASGRIDAYVARVTTNVVYHIGEQTTRASRPAIRTVAARRPAPKARPPLYTPAWQQTRHWTMDHSARCFLTALASFKTPPTAVLDVGCGTGHLIDLAKRRGMDGLGVDVSVSESSDQPHIKHADLRQPLALGRTFPLVLCWEVAEHLPPESADQLCDSLAAHVSEGGLLLFTAATPGQGGQGHLTERSHEFWREKLEARGLKYEAKRTEILARQWKAVAPKTPWYGKNLQIFRKTTRSEVMSSDSLPTVGAAATGAQHPVKNTASDIRVAITMRTADRSPNPNYVAGTIGRLLKQGIPAADLHVCLTNPDVAWFDRALGDVAGQVTRHVPDRVLTPNENGLAQIATLDPTAYGWVLLLEDDLAFCADFLGSVQRWIIDHAKPSRHFYRLFAFRVNTPTRSVGAYDSSLERCAGSQAVLLRMSDALDFVDWARSNLEQWGGFRGNARIAFDKLLASWMGARHPKEPGVMSQPMFVKHIGKVSSLHPKTAHMDQAFGGEHWSYRPVRPSKTRAAWSQEARMALLWPKGTVVCIAGGTVSQEEVESVRGRAGVIVINESYRLAPWADVLYGADPDWWHVHKGVPEFAGLKYAVAPHNNAPARPAFPADVQVLVNDPASGLSDEPRWLRTGGAGKPNSGHQAIGLAVLGGATRIILLGYDLQPLADGRTHWFGSHKSPLRNPDRQQFRDYRTQFDSLVEPAKARGITIFNCSTHSALDAFPRLTLEEALREDTDEAASLESPSIEALA